MIKLRNSKIFGTDGVRGKANSAPMDVETVLALGRAAGLMFKKESEKPRVVIGKDTRLSCYMYENALISGLCSMGVDTFMLGPIPTPGVAFITKAYRADAGIVISASHNPFYDNGIKFFSSEGFKFSDTWEDEIEKLVKKNDFTEFLPADDQVGKNTKINDADGRYIEFIKGTFPRKKSLKGLKIALDCANGAGYKVAPLVFKELDAEVFVYSASPNGLNINQNCGSLHPEVIQKAVIDHGAHVGIALDGDADRVIMVDEKGQIVDGDAMLAICAKDMMQKGKLLNNRVVSTVMANYGFLKAMENLNIEVVSSQVGDRYVIQDMFKYDAILGGEQSGHLIFREQNTTGDGLVCALQVLRIMVETGSSLSELLSFFQKYPQSLLNVKVVNKPELDSIMGLKEVIEEVERLLDGSGRVLVRYSGTEKICRVMVEAPSQEKADGMARLIADVIRKEIGIQ